MSTYDLFRTSWSASTARGIPGMGAIAMPAALASGGAKGSATTHVDESSGSSRDRQTVPLGGLVGRDQEVEEVLALLRNSRLLTLTGAPGVGKTRLARDLASYFPEPVWLVDLASTVDAAGVPSLVASCLDAPPAPGRSADEAVVGHLDGEAKLLILDNCEHLIGEVSRLARVLLERCGRLRVLVTTREPLKVPPETVWRLPPLSLPPPGSPGLPEAVVDSDAVLLFCERAAAVERGFLPTAGNIEAITEICRRLDGLPLAIELAARRVEALSPGDIAAHLRSGFSLLADASGSALPRHQSLTESLQWSYGLLEAQERALLRRLSVFAGGFGLDAARVVGGGEDLGPDEVVGLLARLVSKSLVVADTTKARTRYRLLGTIRHFAREKLVGSGELDDGAARHATWCLRLDGGGAGRERLDGERENLAAALEWSMAAGRAETALQLARTHALVCRREDAEVAASEGLARALSLPAPVPAALRAQTLLEAGLLAHDLNELSGSRALLAEALHLAQECGDGTTEGRSLHHLGRLARAEGDDEGATDHQLDALDLQNKIGDRAGLADTLEALAALAVNSRHVRHSARLFGAAQSLREATGCIRMPSNQGTYEAAVDLARRRMGPAAFEAGWRDGAEYPTETAAGYVSKRRRSSGPAPTGREALTNAERRVERLVAEGLTNAEIAGRLFVSVRTVESHVRNIFTKLCVNSRRELVRPAYGLWDS